MCSMSRQGTSVPGWSGADCATMPTSQRVHGSCAAKGGNAVLVIGPSGSGKSDLVLRLIARGFELVSDDQVNVDSGVASPPPAIAGLLEVRGLGIMRLPFDPSARLRLVVDLGGHAERLPHPAVHRELGLPLMHLDAGAASAPDRVAMALDCLLGRTEQVAGAFRP
jgi:HPr kinase/phosphorylase